MRILPFILVALITATPLLNAQNTSQDASTTTLRPADRGLLLAARTNNIELAIFSLERGAKIDTRENNEEADPVLVVATKAGADQVVRKLLTSGAAPDIAGQSGITALMHAARNSRLDVLTSLLDAGADISTRDQRDGYTALLHAVEAGSRETVERLLIAGADCNRADTARGMTPLIRAASRRTGYAIVIDLLGAGANPNLTAKDGFTALMSAARHNRADVVELLLLNSADADRTTDDNRSAMTIASTVGATDIVDLLIAHTETDSPNNQRSASINASLQQAAAGGHYKIVNKLLAAGADPNAADAAGLTPLHGAVMGGYLDIVTALLDQGARPDTGTTDDGHTALMLAANRDMLEIVQQLLIAGADVSIVGHDEWTAKKAAEMIGATEIVTLLKEHATKNQ